MGRAVGTSFLAVGIVTVLIPLAVRVEPPRVTASGETIAPPSSIPADCSSDVSKSLSPWFNSLPPDTTVDVPSGACYQVDEGIALNFPSGLTVDGGTFENTATSPPPSGKHGINRGYPAFNVLGGSGVTFENMTIEGADPTGTYTATMAFAGGIELQGTGSATISQVTVDGVFGDGVTLAPLRGGKDHESGKIVSPVDNVTISTLTVDGAGRMGITFGSVNGAQVSNVSASNVGLDTFDVEADQGNEGAVNVTIDGCTSSSEANSNFARSFFANDGVGSAKDTGDITVENCSMTEPQGTAAIQAERPGESTTPRGPILFDDDELSCEQSFSPSVAACLVVQGSDVTIENSSVTFPSPSSADEVYDATVSSSLTLPDDDVSGFSSVGTADSTSTVTVTGGTWTPAT